ncbi:Lanthionine synthetase C-like [Lasallia pustulata]|uniref:Lanthionine synthetase C-like n=1 Tax=Lasallia pustulata TaxID=136370 RepID=A0A1W5D260_9LECA|nr:Lanthionine synthetase C-like [Lasallia pustulata]
MATPPFEITSLHHRYFTITAPTALPSPTSELTSVLTSIISELKDKSSSPTPPFSWHGLFLGPTSFAYLLYRLSHLHPALTISSSSLPHLASWTLSQPPPAAVLSSPKRGGIADEAMATTTTTALLTSSLSHATSVVAMAAQTISPEHCPSNEWLYGRAGTLYLLRALKSHFTSSSPAPGADALLTAIETTIAAICGTILHSPRPWTWHNKHYLGAAHGSVGIITQVVLSRPACAPAVRDDLVAVLDAQLSSGNWPSSLPFSGDDKLVQFCHGAPGVVISLRSLAPYFPELGAEIESAVERGERCVVERGALRKEACLCHGMAGNAMAVGGGEGEGVEREKFYACMGEGVLGRLVERGVVQEWERSKVDLMGGKAGVAWAWGVRGTGMEGKMVGYNDV